MEREEHERQPRRAERDDPERLAAEMSREADRLESESEKLESDIEHARSEWHARRRDPTVPGAVEPEGERPEEQSGDAGEHGPKEEPRRDPGGG